MGWFRRGRRARSGGRAAADIEGRAAADIDADVLRCATCGAVLDGDPDEDPTGDAGLPICGECARSRHFVVLDAADGDLDGRIA